MFAVQHVCRRSFRVILLGLAIGFFSDGAVTQAQPKPEDKGASDKAAEIKTLLKERQEVLNKIVAGLMNQWQAGLLGDFTRVAQAQRDALKATLELEESLEKRIVLLQEQQKIAKTLLEIAEGRLKIGGATGIDVDQAKAIFLEARVELLREELKLKPRK